MPLLEINPKTTEGCKECHNMATFDVATLDVLVKQFPADVNRPFSYSAKEPGSSVIFIHFYTRDSIEWRKSFYHNCAHSKILQNVAKYRSIEILSQNK